MSRGRSHAIDPTQFSTTDAALELEKQTVAQAFTVDLLGGVYERTVRVLSVPLPLSEVHERALFTRKFTTDVAADTDYSVSTGTVKTKGFSFFGRILAQPNLPSPHQLYKDPCRMDATGTGTAALEYAKVLKDHTLFISAESYNGPMPQVGAIVTVTIQPGSYTANLSEGYFTSISSNTEVMSNIAQSAKTCEERLRNLFAGGTAATGYTPPAPQVTALDLSWDSLQNYVEPLSELMQWVAASEGNVESVNRGRAGDSRGGAENYIPNENGEVGPGKGRKLTDLTISEVLTYQRKGSRASLIPKSNYQDESTLPAGEILLGPGLFAVGKYQWIPDTLREAVDILKSRGLNPATTKFDQDAQERLGVYLLLMKPDRRYLGNYLTGNSSGQNALQWAAQDLALEWASQPLQFRYVWRKRDGTVRSVCERGFSAYCKAGNNRTTKNPDTPLPFLKRARASLLTYVEANPSDQLYNTTLPTSRSGVDTGPTGQDDEEGFNAAQAVRDAQAAAGQQPGGVGSVLVEETVEGVVEEALESGVKKAARKILTRGR